MPVDAIDIERRIEYLERRLRLLQVSAAVVAAYFTTGFLAGLLLAAAREPDSLKLAAVYGSMALGAVCLWQTTRIAANESLPYRFGFLAACVAGFFVPFTLVHCSIEWNLTVDHIKDYTFFGLGVFVIALVMGFIRQRTART